LIAWHSSYLDIITQAANVITLATNVEVFASGDIIRETFPDLNIAQIRKLLQLYSPDQYVGCSMRRAERSELLTWRVIDRQSCTGRAASRSAADHQPDVQRSR